MTPWARFGVFIVNFEYISHLALVFLLLTLKMQLSDKNTNNESHILLENEIPNIRNEQPLNNKNLYLNFKLQKQTP